MLILFLPSYGGCRHCHIQGKSAATSKIRTRLGFRDQKQDVEPANNSNPESSAPGMMSLPDFFGHLAETGDCGTIPRQLFQIFIGSKRSPARSFSSRNALPASSGMTVCPPNVHPHRFPRMMTSVTRNLG